MPEELSLAIQQICEEKGLSIETVKETIEDALAAAYRKDFGDKKTQNIRVKFDLATGSFEVFDVKEVVEDELKEKYEEMKEEIERLKKEGKEITEEMVKERQEKREIRNLPRAKPLSESERAESRGQKLEIEEEEKQIRNQKSGIKEGEKGETEEVEEEKRFNPRTMISLSEAKAENKKLKVGDELVRKLEVPASFGRMAAQTAKQVIIQKLREAERNSLYQQYKEKMGDLIVGTVQRQENRLVLVDLGQLTALLLAPDQVRTDKYVPGGRMKFYVKSVEQTSKGPEVLISRSHPEILRKLFKLEVPEINSGAVQIKAIARDAGARSKIAVVAKEENVDPIGSCIGQRGTRVQTVINELGGEKIDIIEWDENKEKFISNALAPAKVLKVEIDEKNELVKAYVKEEQYSLAIGKGGQNVRLAAQLVGMRINVVMEKAEEPKNEETEAKKEKVVKEENGEEIEKLRNKEIKAKEEEGMQGTQEAQKAQEAQEHESAKIEEKEELKEDKKVENKKKKAKKEEKPAADAEDKARK